MNRLIAAVIAAVLVIYLLFSSLFVVNEREQAIVLRFGAIERIIKQPGIYFKIPTSLVDSVQIIEDRLLRYDLANMRLQVSGGAFYVVDAFLTYRITDPRLFRERAQGDLRVAESRIGTRFDAALRQVYGLRGFDAALSEQRPQMMDEARDLIRPDMETLGINVVDVRILRTDLTPEVSAQTYERMKAERLAQAAFLRAQGQEAAQSLRAIADRQGIEIVAAAQRDADILRGQGDAERNKIFAQAYSVDPEFFEFYRSMDSYRTALAGANTTMVLSPDSEFFRYFGTDTQVPATTVGSPSAGIAAGPGSSGRARPGPVAPTAGVGFTPTVPEGGVALPVEAPAPLPAGTPAPSALPAVSPVPATAPAL